MIDELLDALHEYHEARREYIEYRNSTRASPLKDLVESKREQAETKLNEIIDARIKAHLQEQRA